MALICLIAAPDPGNTPIAVGKNIASQWTTSPSTPATPTTASLHVTDLASPWSGMLASTTLAPRRTETTRPRPARYSPDIPQDYGLGSRLNRARAAPEPAGSHRLDARIGRTQLPKRTGLGLVGPLHARVSTPETRG